MTLEEFQRELSDLLARATTIPLADLLDELESKMHELAEEPEADADEIE